MFVMIVEKKKKVPNVPISQFLWLFSQLSKKSREKERSPRSNLFIVLLL